MLKLLTKARRVPRPMPLVAPTKTATRLVLEGEDLNDRLEVRTSVRETILRGC